MQAFAGTLKRSTMAVSARSEPAKSASRASSGAHATASIARFHACNAHTGNHLLTSLISMPKGAIALTCVHLALSARVQQATAQDP